MNHLFIALPNPSDETVLKLNKMFHKFIWQSSIVRIKREVLCQEYNNGGLKMIQLNNYINALKIGWIRRLIRGNSKYKILFETIHTSINDILNRGETYIEEIKSNCTNKFWWDVLEAWKKLTLKLKPTSASDSIWNNGNIRIDTCNNAVFYRRWYSKNIYFIKDLLDEHGHLLTYEQFQEKYNVQTNFLEFTGIKTAIVNYLRRSQIDVSHEACFNCHWPFIVKLIMKTRKGSTYIYKLFTKKNVAPNSQQKWNRVFGNIHLSWKDIYTIPAKSCSNTKMRWFQYRIMHRIIATNDLLMKMNIRQNNLCTFCNQEIEKIEHLFWHCNIVNQFWETVEQWVLEKNNYMLNVDKYRAIFGIPNTSLAMIPINYILIVTRHYIYKCRISSSNLNLLSWANYVKKILELEKPIAIKNNKYDKMKIHWDKWFTIFNV